MTIQVFPTLKGEGLPAKRMAQWSSVRHVATSQKRTVTPKQAFPRWQWKIPFEFLRSAAFGSSAAYSELETLLGFFNARSADGAIFSYTDHEDNTALAAPFGTGDGATTQFQLYRAYGGFTEPCYGAAPAFVYVAGVSTAFTISSIGVVTFAVAPAIGAALTWDGPFSFLCRFDDDVIDIDRLMKGYHQGAPLSWSSEMAL